jgi:hypothetical protein
MEPPVYRRARKFLAGSTKLIEASPLGICQPSVPIFLRTVQMMKRAGLFAAQYLPQLSRHPHRLIGSISFQFQTLKFHHRPRAGTAETF